MKSTYVITHDTEYPGSKNTKSFLELGEALSFLMDIGTKVNAKLTRTYIVTETLNPTVTNISFKCGYDDARWGKKKQNEKSAPGEYYWSYCEGYKAGLVVLEKNTL